MAKRPRESDSDDTTISAAACGAVFVDTSFDTHIAMTVSSSDTVLDFKEKMVLEHMKFFPTFGEIQIQSLKVKRKSNFYYLPDSMLVWSAFQGVKGDCFLSVDASRAPLRGLNQNSSGHGITDGVKMKDSDDIRSVMAYAGQTKALPVTSPCDVKDGASEMTAGAEKSLEQTNGLLRDGYSEENCKVFHSKKKLKMKHTNDVHHSSNLQGSCNLVRVLSDLRNDQSNIEATAENTNIDSDKRKVEVMLESMAPENIIACEQAHKLGPNAQTESPGAISGVLPVYSTARLMDASGTMEDVNSDSSRRTKKKCRKVVSEIHVKTHVEQAGKVDNTNLYTETHKAEEKKEEKNISVNHDHEVAISSDKKSADYGVPDPVQKESVEAHADAVMEPEIKSDRKKRNRKKRKKEEQSANTNLENSGVEQMNNGISGTSGLLFPPTERIPEANDTEDGSSHHQMQDVKMELLDSSAIVASKDQGASGNDADFVALTQSSQTDVANAENILEQSSRSSSGNCNEDLPSIEKDQGCNQVDKNNQNTENKDKKARMKRKKAQHRASDVHKRLSADVQKVGTEVLMTEVALVNLARSKEEVGHVSSSSIPSNESEEKAEEMNRTAVETGVPANFSSENEAAGINFKQCFVSGQSQGEVDFGHREEEATKLKVKKTNKKFIKNGAPSPSISTELQISLKTYENQESEYKSHDKDISGTRAGDSIHNSDQNEVIPNSSKTTVTVPGVDVEGSCPTEKQEMKSTKIPDGNLAALPYPKEKYRTSNKSGSARSVTLLENRGSEGLQSGLNANKNIMKTKQKKSLLTKSGTIFEDSNGESSVDEYETVHTNHITRSPSDSSSPSSHSETVGESDLSQDSPMNGSNNAKEPSTVGKTPAKLDLSAAKDLSMEMILRSSKRFKKAKLQASKNNGEENDNHLPEFVPI